MDLRALVERLLEESATVEGMAALMGPTVERQARRLHIRPDDPRFREGWVGWERDPALHLPPDYPELWTSEGSAPRVDELSRLFGPGERVPPSRTATPSSSSSGTTGGTPRPGPPYTRP